MYHQVYLTQGRPLEGQPILAFGGAGSPAAPRPAPQGGAAGSAPTLILRGEQGPLAGQQIPVSASPFTIGRNPDNHLALPEANVSRRHAQLDLRGGRWWLQDLDSANGTAVNRQRLSPAQPVPLSSGDVITIGESVFTAVLQAPARPAAPPRAAQAAAKPRRTSPVLAIVVGLVLVAVVVAVVLILANQLGTEEEVAPGPALPTIALPDIEIPTVQIPTIVVPTFDIPTVLPIPTAAQDLMAPLQTALPELKLPINTPEP